MKRIGRIGGVGFGLRWGVLAGAILLLAATAAVARTTVMRAGNLVLETSGVVLPKERPRDVLTPAFFKGKGEISTVDGLHPPAIREVVAEFDRDTAIDAVGFPTCSFGQLQARTVAAARGICGDAIVGTGTGAGEVAFPDQPAIAVSSPVTLFNGGTKNGVTTIFGHGYITVPTPAAIVSRLTIRKVHHGGYGLRAVLAIPRIAGGSGSIESFELEFGRLYAFKGRRKSYDLAKCTDGHLDIRVLKADFRDETGGVGGAVLRGTLLNPCIPKG